ncbi:hypothetical protein R3I94_007381 [Phoxinus phoxinus]
MGYNDTIRSCCTFSNKCGGSYCIRIYNRPDFQGQMMEFSDDCGSIHESFQCRSIHSCNVMEGYWTFYEHPSFRGRQYFMPPGEYRKFSDWGAMCATIGSFCKITDFYSPHY